MQMAVVEYARHVLGLTGAHTSEVDPNTPYQMEDHVNSTMYKYALDTLIARGENLDFYNRLVAVYDEHNTIGK